MEDVPFDARDASDAQRAQVEAIGEPGKRRFRLMTIVEGETYIAWMEKQQIDALGRALEQVLDQVQDPSEDVMFTANAVAFDLATRRQFRVGRMELGFDQERDSLVIIAHDIEAESDERPALTCRFSRAQAREISREAATVVAAGRPRCVLCGQPMDTGPHACPQQNGHLPGELSGGIDIDDLEP